MKIKSYISRGFDGEIVEVEVDLRRGIPGMDVVGLPDVAVREARERVRAALRNSGFAVPRERVLINLAPAGVKKEGASFDLSIAVAILLATGQVHFDPKEEGLLVVGELELSGKVRGGSGVLAAVASALEGGVEKALVPQENLREAQSVSGTRPFGISSLADVSSVGASLVHGIVLGSGNADGDEGETSIFGEKREKGGVVGPQRGTARRSAESSEYDLSDMIGGKKLKRVIEIAAAGGHNLLLFGPPGVGKTMAARRLAPLLPELTPEEAMEVTRIHSLAGLIGPEGGLIKRPPMRAPHHTASREGLIGGADGRPGEISLAHRGVLFLDEALEFHKTLLQSLREPIERGEVEVARAGVHYRYPSRFQMILAANPCPCGKLGQPEAVCMCSKLEIHRYWKKLGAALMDRVDMRLPVEPEPLNADLVGEKSKAGSRTLAGGVSDKSTEKKSVRNTSRSAGLEKTAPSSESEDVRRKVIAAGEMQRARCAGNSYHSNAEMGPETVFSRGAISGEAGALLSKASARLGLSSRAVQSVAKVARTIADLEAEETVEKRHVAEAVEYRRYGDGDYYWRAA